MPGTEPGSNNNSNEFRMEWEWYESLLCRQSTAATATTAATAALATAANLGWDDDGVCLLAQAKHHRQQQQHHHHQNFYKFEGCRFLQCRDGGSYYDVSTV